MDVLVVEDDAALAEVIARNVRARGHTSRVADAAEAAVTEISKARPDIVLLDVNLPDASGWDVLRRIDRSYRQQLKVIVISAGQVSQNRIDEFRPDRQLVKPFPIDALMRVLEELQGEESAGNGQERDLQ